MTTVHVLVAYNDHGLKPVTAELLSAARILGEPEAVIVGEPGTTDRFADELAHLGAATILAAEAPGTANRIVLDKVDALAAAAAAAPGPILVAHSADGAEIAGRLAARLGSGFLRDVTALAADGTATQSIFGDTWTLTSAVGGESPVYSVRPGAVKADPIPAAGTVYAIDLPAAGDLDVTVDSFTPAVEEKRPNLSQASVVVAGGRGVGGPEGFTGLVEPLADALGGAVGATRDVIEQDWYPAHFQIGQTGVTVSPDLYIGVGISGAIQHRAGMQTAATIVCINTDEDAPLFDISDFGVVGDAAAVVPALTTLIEQSK